MSEPRRLVRHPPPIPSSCAGMWADAVEPAWGTAASAGFFVAVEQPGPWGNKALTQSHLDPAVGGELERRCAGAGGRALLIRRPGAHPATAEDVVRRVYVSGGMPSGSPWLCTGEITDPALVLDLPFETFAGRDPAPAMAALPALGPAEGAVLLVCTNAKRDTCCAMLGRPVAVDAAAHRPDRIWECTHTGGHRFSPTGVLLPSGATLARLSTKTALAAVDAADEGRIASELNDARHHRGLAHLAPPLQAVDAYVRAEMGEGDPTALQVTLLRPAPSPTDDALIEVLHRARGRRLLFARKRYDEARQRKNSCATGPVPAESWIVTPADDQVWVRPSR